MQNEPTPLIQKFWYNTWLAWREGVLAHLMPGTREIARQPFDGFLQSPDVKHPTSRRISRWLDPKPEEFLIGFDDKSDFACFVLTSHRLLIRSRKDKEWTEFLLSDIADYKSGGLLSYTIDIKTTDGAVHTMSKVDIAPIDDVIGLALKEAHSENPWPRLTKKPRSKLRGPDRISEIVKSGDRKRVRDSLRARDAVGINQLDSEGMAPLHWAAGFGYVDIVELLLDKGADIDLCNEGQGTPLHLAAWEGYSELVELLLRKGAACDTDDVQGYTPLHLAVWKGFADIVDLLLKAGSDVYYGDYRGWTALHFAAYHGRPKVAELLLQKKKYVAVKNEEAETPLGMAIKRGHGEVARILRSHGATE